MTTFRQILNEESAILLDGVAQTKLPVLITGGLVSGKSSIAEGFARTHGYGLLDGVKNPNLPQEVEALKGLVKALMDAKEGKVVIVMIKPQYEITELLGRHIHIQAFTDTQDSTKRYMKIVPVFESNRENLSSFGDKHKIVITEGVKSNSSKPPVFSKVNNAVVEIDTVDKLKTMDVLIQSQILFKNTAQGIEIEIDDNFPKMIFDINLDEVPLSRVIERLKVIKEHALEDLTLVHMYVQSLEELKNKDKSLYTVRKIDEILDLIDMRYFV